MYLVRILWLKNLQTPTLRLYIWKNYCNYHEKRKSNTPKFKNI